MSPKSSIASLCLAALAMPALAQAPPAEVGAEPEPPRRGLPLEVERGGRLPSTEPPAHPPESPEREDIEALSLDLGPVPRTVVLGEGASPATWKQLRSLPDVLPVLQLSRGNMIRPGLLARLGRLDSVGLWMTAPLLPVHREQLEDLPGLSRLTLVVGPDKEAEALRAVEPLPPLLLTIYLSGPVTAERLEPWLRETRARIFLDLRPGGEARATLRVLEGIPREDRGRLGLFLARDTASDHLEAIARLGPGEVVLLEGGSLPARETLEALSRASRALRVRLGFYATPTELVGLRGLPGLRLELWLSGGVRRREARGALDLLGRTLGDRKPR